MATISRDTKILDVPDPDQCVSLRGVDWSGYRSMLRIRGESHVPKIIYLDGEMWLMSPSYPHERLEARLAMLVRIVAEELDIPFTSAGHTTFWRKKRRAGIEGDATFYFANESRIRGKTDLDLRIDPPPDLAIEAVHINPAEPAVATWRRLRVPEIWVGESGGIRIWVRQADGEYRESSHSTCLPSLTRAEIAEWVYQPETTSELDWIKALRRWAGEVLVPRTRN